ncbi:hypothetical protein EDC04DRAFT_2899955 [Pisolithus marmoratus]|nr:hypothetical protein EDC04DRAFT_2899955 [Pisolithus marmoratus]
MAKPVNALYAVFPPRPPIRFIAGGITRCVLWGVYGAYCAPELLFGPRSYDAFAIDRWSLGVTFAEFFIPIRLRSDEQDAIDTFIDPDSESDADEPPVPPEPFTMTKGVRPTDPTVRWVRDGLFEGEHGEIMLTANVFKVHGPPNGTNWPSFMQLSDAGKVLFLETSAVDLAPLLPQLPPSLRQLQPDTKAHTPSAEKSPNRHCASFPCLRTFTSATCPGYTAPSMVLC